MENVVFIVLLVCDLNGTSTWTKLLPNGTDIPFGSHIRDYFSCLIIPVKFAAGLHG